MQPIPIGAPPITPDWFGIWYQPMKDEIDLVALPIVRERGLRPSFVIPQNKDTRPEGLLEQIKNELSIQVSRPVYLFIPGTQFDHFGTRHGRGGGWYDRFLVLCPREWMRIGVARSEQIQNLALPRRAWDQEMDWLVIESQKTDG